MYPLWEVPYLGPGMILGLIATFHILPSHLSTSAMWFNLYIETKAYRENRPELLEFINRYSLLLLIFGYVFGSLSGVGIWFAATVASPRGISALIHNYVWGWATEWVFFIIEVLTIFAYYYTFKKVDRKTHLTLGWIFAIGSWTTMIVITGILAFMATPGPWLKTGAFFDGFFNPTYWPQLFMRTFLMFAIAGVYAIVVATRMTNEAARQTVVRSASILGIVGLVLGSATYFWYAQALPAPALKVMAKMVSASLKWGMIGSVIVTILYFLFNAVKPNKVGTFPAVAMIFVLFIGIWSVERSREIIRKPYVLPGYMYSNQIISADFAPKQVSSEVKKYNKEGFLTHAAFIPEACRTASGPASLEAGKTLARMQCVICHSLEDGGVRALNPLLKRASVTDKDIAYGFVDGIGRYSYMPPFVGTESEKLALAEYLGSLVPAAQ